MMIFELGIFSFERVWHHQFDRKIQFDRMTKFDHKAKSDRMAKFDYKVKSDHGTKFVEQF